MNFVFHGPDLDPFQVFGSLNGKDVVGDLAKPVLPEGQALDPLGGKGTGGHPADRP